MIKAPLCINPECQTPLKTRYGKTGLCRRCSLKANGVALGEPWTPQEQKLINENAILQKRIRWNRAVIMQRHNYRAYQNKLDWATAKLRRLKPVESPVLSMPNL